MHRNIRPSSGRPCFAGKPSSKSATGNPPVNSPQTLHNNLRHVTNACQNGVSRSACVTGTPLRRQTSILFYIVVYRFSCELYLLLASANSRLGIGDLPSMEMPSWEWRGAAKLIFKQTRDARAVVGRSLHRSLARSFARPANAATVVRR